MLPVQILDLLLIQASKLLFDAPRLTLPVIGIHPEQQCRRQDQDRAGSGEIEAVANMVIGTVPRKERPGGNETLNFQS